jgi:DNA helicase II / ATP-dependent DNA helicase PcrA
VLVVLDDEEASYNQYSYGKYLGYTPLSDADEANIAEGKESVLDRTRRLFYVCCSRAAKDLAVVLFAADVVAARAAVVKANLFPDASHHGIEQLG